MRIAVIIPTLNEAQSIQQTLLPLQRWRQAGHDVILVDGGSHDPTVSLAEPLVDKVLITETAGRAWQMNSGATLAGNADILLFLHADTLVDETSYQLITRAVTEGAKWGRFNVCFDSMQWYFRLIALAMNIRSCLSSIATGDQAIFVRRGLYDAVGGIPDQILMEDIEFSKRLKRLQRVKCLRRKVCTSARRWQQKGVIRTVLLMWWLRLAYFFGASPDRLARLYR